MISARSATKLALALSSLAVAPLAGGCGDAERIGTDRLLRLAMSEYRVHPQSARVSAGTLTIFVQNYGRLTHNLVVSLNGQSAGSTKPIAPGQSVELFLKLTPGTYVMASTILSDEALGEYGTLTVTR